MKFIAKLEMLLLAMWLGAACLFSFAAAPIAFRVLDNPETAGSIVSYNLFIVNVAGLIIGTILLALTFLPRDYGNAAVLWIRRGLLLIIAVGCAVGQFVIGVWISMVRAQAGKPINQLEATDPLKLRFDQLHQASVWFLVAAVVAGLIAFFLIRGKSKEKVSAENADNVINFDEEFKI